jgi:hypothetical protein
MHSSLKNIIAELLNIPQTKKLIKSQKSNKSAFINKKKNKAIEEAVAKITQQKNLVIKRFSLNKLEVLEPTEKYMEDLNGKRYNKNALGRQPLTYTEKQIESLEIHNAQLTAFATKILINDLISNNDFYGSDTYKIFEIFESQDKLTDILTVREYNKIKSFVFMQKMRAKHCDEKQDENGKKYYELKEDAALDQILTEIKALTLQNEEAKTIWDYIKSFFQSIARALHLREGPTALEQKEQIRSNNAAKIAEAGGNENDLRSFQQFVTTYEQKVNSELTHNANF